MQFVLMDYDLWKERTYLRTKRRSSALRRVDEALKAYHLRGRTATLKAGVGSALDSWKSSKGHGNAWVRSARNVNGAVNDLSRQIAGVQVTPEDRIAIQFLKDNREKVLRQLFTGRKLVIAEKWTTALSIASRGKGAPNNVYRHAEELHRHAQGQEAGAESGVTVSEVRGLVNDILGDALQDIEFLGVVEEVVGEALEELITSITPYVGFVKSTAKAVYYNYQTLKKAKSYYGIQGKEGCLLPGDPSAAFDAILVLLDRSLKVSGAKAATHSLEATAKGAGLFLDLGTASTAAAGIVGGVTRILVTLRCLKLDWDETRKANALLKDPASIDSGLFAASPILGAYFLCCTDTSTIVNLCFEDIFRPGMAYRVDKAVRSGLDPILKKANKLIYNHRMKLDGPPLPFLSVEGDQGQITMRSAGISEKMRAAVGKKLRGREKGFYK